MTKRRADRAYEYWAPEEDNLLRREQHRTVRELARMLGRRQGAVRSRLRKLGLTETPSTPIIVERSIPPRPRLGWVVLSVMAALAIGIVIGRATAPIITSSPPIDQEKVSSSSDAGDKVSIAAVVPTLGGVGADDDLLTFVTWNVRGYPEKLESDTVWFHHQLMRLGVDVLCIQEIANLERVHDLRVRDGRLGQFAFVDSPSGFDNAIFADGHVDLEDMPNPAGFQHPPQVAYVSYKGFDAVVACLHLTWKNASIRDHEIETLALLVPHWLEHDPDVMLVGDFNLTTGAAEGLARRLGMSPMTVSDQDGVGTTHSGNRYDHFLISADLANEEAVSARIETFAEDDPAVAQRVSDHLPVVATFRTDECLRDRPSCPQDPDAP